MHTRWMVLVMLLLASLPVAMGQPDETLMQDDEGDLEATVEGQQVGALAERYQGADLSWADIQEEDTGFQVTIGVADLSEPTPPTFVDSIAYRLHLRFHDIDFVVEMADDRDLLGSSYSYGRVYSTYEEDGYVRNDYRDSLDVTFDRAAGTIKTFVPRDALTDEDGAPPALDDQFKDLWVESTALMTYVIGGPSGPVGRAEIRDRMPDADAIPALPIRIGVHQSGDASLVSPKPFRLSNGGATSVVYSVLAQNSGDVQEFAFDVEGVPEAWQVSLPFDRAILDEGENLTFPVLLTTTSGHSHGGLDAFLVTMTGQRDSGDVGRVELGLKYTDIPQPAGHHPRLYFHSYQPYTSTFDPLADVVGDGFLLRSSQGYLNAAEEDPGDLGRPVAPYGTVVPGLESYFEWYLPLMPRLGMGLDFDIKRDGSISVPIQYDYLASDVVLTGELSHYDPGTRERTTVATLTETTPVSWQQGVHMFEAPLQIEDEADFIAYHEDAYLELELRLRGSFIGPAIAGPGAMPMLQTNGFIDLPLQEYRDNLDTFYDAVQGLRFDNDVLERQVNPGEAVIFETTLRNDGRHDEPVILELDGVNGDWSRILGANAFTLAPGEERTVAVAVSAPKEVTDGSIADLVLQAASERDPHRRAVVDMVAVVDAETDHPDDGGRIAELDESLQEGGKKSPGFEIAAVAMGLLAIAVVLRRRRE